MKSFASPSLHDVSQQLDRLELPARDQAAILEQIQSSMGQRQLQEDSIIGFARRVHRAHLRADEHLGPGVVRDPRWEMLLELFIAHHDQRRVCVTSLCQAANSPATTGLRHIEALEKLGLVFRRGDPHDARRTWLEAGTKALYGVKAVLGEMQISG